MALDPQVERVLDLVRSSGSPDYSEMNPDDAREWHQRTASLLDIPPEPLYGIEDRAVDGPRGEIPLRVYTPRQSAEPLPVFVWMHGGGHVVGSIDSYDALCRMFALRVDCVVVSVDYRLAPEHRFPAGVDDCFAALCWVGAHAAALGGDAARIAIGGDSAGGNLAAVCAILARDAGFPALAFQLLVYPRTAADEESASHRTFAEGYLLTRRTILWFHGHYRNAEDDRSDFRYAPLVCQDLTRLPPALVIVAEFDPLRDDGIAYAQALERAGNRVTLSEYGGMVHSFFSLGGAVDTAREAHAEAATALKAAFRAIRRANA